MPRAADASPRMLGRVGVGRPMVGLLAGLAAAGLALAGPAATACACGGVVDQAGSDTTVTGETAVIVWDGETQVVTVQLDADSDATDAGLLIPTPTPAETALGDAAMFEDLALASRPREEERVHWIGPPAIFSNDEDGSGAETGGAPGGVDVLSVDDLGPLEATVLTAEDPDALGEWARDNGYQFGTRFGGLVEPYIDDGWAFVAVRLTTEGASLNGELPPIQLTFPSHREGQAVYPMRMSSGAETSQATRMYLLAEHRMTRVDRAQREGAGADVVFAGTVDPGEVSSRALRRALTDTPYLTTIDQTFARPAEEVTSDFYFRRHESDAPFQQVIYTDVYLIPMDLGILGLALAVLILGGGYAAWRGRRTPTLAMRREQ